MKINVWDLMINWKKKKKGLEQCFDQLIKKLLSIPILSSDGQ